MKWISVKERLPNYDCAYLISGHEWFGIGYWRNNKWASGFIGEFPSDDGSWYSEDDTESNKEWLNESVLYWSEIPNYPIY